MGVQASYPLGYGLSYTRFVLRDARLTAAAADGGGIASRVDVTVTNVGDRAGWCVVQVYACPDLGPGPHDFPSRVLVGFKAEEVREKQSRLVSVDISLQPVLRWRDGRFHADAKRIIFKVGQHAGDSSRLALSSGLPQPML